jgi:hypothetical protein
MKGHSWHLRGCHPIRSFILLMNGHNTPPLFGRAMDWYEVRHAFHYRNTLRNFFKCFVICTSHSLIHGAHILIRELFMIKSIPTGAPYVTLHIKIGWRKVNICGLSSGNWFFFCKFAGLLRPLKNVHLLEKRVINMIGLLFPVFDWPI